VLNLGGWEAHHPGGFRRLPTLSFVHAVSSLNVGNHVVWVQPSRVVYIDVGQPDHPFFIDEEGGWHRQVLRTIGAVEEIERMAELSVKLLQFFSDLENNAKLTGHLVPHIAQYRKSEFILFLCAQRIVWQLRRNSYDLCPKLLQLRQSPLKAPQVQIAVGAPAASVKDQDYWTLTQQRLQADAATLCVGQHEVRAVAPGLRARRSIPEARRASVSASITKKSPTGISPRYFARVASSS